MEEEVKSKFSLPALFLVTGFSFLTFALGLKILDGVNSKFFLWFGVLTFMAGILTRTLMLFGKKQISGQYPEP